MDVIYYLKFRFKNNIYVNLILFFFNSIRNFKKNGIDPLFLSMGNYNMNKK